MLEVEASSETELPSPVQTVAAVAGGAITEPAPQAAAPKGEMVARLEIPGTTLEAEAAAMLARSVVQADSWVAREAVALHRQRPMGVTTAVAGAMRWDRAAMVDSAEEGAAEPSAI